jgi:hypothetical protein
MAPGPAAAVKALGKVLEIDSPPRPAQEWIVEIALGEAWFTSRADAEEAAARWQSAFLTRLRRDHNDLNAIGRVCVYAFNSSSEYMVQGAAFIEEGRDSDELKEAKRRRARVKDYLSALAGLSPTDFEVMCRGILALLGVQQPILTRRSGDEGIDFYGQLRLEDLLQRIEALPDVYRRLAVWMIGQAKHYKATQVATPDIRELVGAIDLARGGAYGGPGARYEDLNILVCDPVFYLFFTTGTISADGWRLLERSGVIGMDGQMVAAFLADQGVGVDADSFSDERLKDWLDELRDR